MMTGSASNLSIHATRKVLLGPALKNFVNDKDKTMGGSQLYFKFTEMTVRQIFVQSILFLGFRISDVGFEVMCNQDASSKLIITYACQVLLHDNGNLEKIWSKLRHLSAILAQWICPEMKKGMRENRFVWRTFIALQLVLGLERIGKNEGRKKAWKNMMRIMYPDMQNHLMGIKRSRKMLASYLDIIITLLCEPEKLSSNAFVYTCFSTATNVWYIGRAANHRKRNKQIVSGYICRFKEHFQAVYKPTNKNMHQKRYGIWSKFPQHTWHMMPVIFGSHKFIANMENCTIRYLNPGWQEPPKSESRSFRSRPFRAYKTHRKEVSDLDNCKLNFHVQFALSKKDPTKQKHAFDNYKDHVTDFKKVHGKNEEYIKTHLYDVAFVWSLVLYLALPCTRLDWKRVWQHGKNTAIYALQIWKLAKILDTYRMRRVQLKIKRFLSTTPLVPTKRFVIRIPSMNTVHLNKVRNIIKTSLYKSGTFLPKLVIEFLLSLIIVRPCAARKSDFDMMDQIETARNFIYKETKLFSHQEKKEFKKRADIQWLPDHFSIGTFDDFDKIKSTCLWQLKCWASYVELPNLHLAIHQASDHWIDTDCEESKKRIDWINSMNEKKNQSHFSAFLLML